MKNALRVLFVGIVLTLSILAAAQAQQTVKIPYCWELCAWIPPECDPTVPGICWCDNGTDLGDCPSYCDGLCGT